MKKLFLFVLITCITVLSYAQNWNEVIKTVASDRSIDDHFGYSVSISGNYAIVGAPFEDKDLTGINILDSAGSAYVYERDGLGNWNEKQKIVASDRGVGGGFGGSVSISGNYIIVWRFRSF